MTLLLINVIITQIYNIYGVKMGYIYYCPYCGAMLPHQIEQKPCGGCGLQIKSAQTKYEYDHYEYLSAQKYNGDKSHVKEIIMEEISQNPLYDPTRFDSNEAKAYRQKRIEEWKEKVDARAAAQREASLPKCPLCGSTKLKKISAIKRGVHAAAFGIFSKTAFSQFECESCHYKF